MFRADCFFRRRRRSELRRDGERGKMQEQMLKWHKETGKRLKHKFVVLMTDLGLTNWLFVVAVIWLNDYMVHKSYILGCSSTKARLFAEVHCKWYIIYGFFFRWFQGTQCRVWWCGWMMKACFQSGINSSICKSWYKVEINESVINVFVIIRFVR